MAATIRIPKGARYVEVLMRVALNATVGEMNDNTLIMQYMENEFAAIRNLDPLDEVNQISLRSSFDCFKFTRNQQIQRVYRSFLRYTTPAKRKHQRSVRNASPVI